MSTYTPDAWVILRIEQDGEVIHKVMGGWYGGFGGADSWRLNSGITKVERGDNGLYRIHGYSGSVYVVHESAQRTTMLMSGIIGRLTEIANVQIVDISEVLNGGY